MNRRGFLKFLAAVPIALAVKPPKKKRREPKFKVSKPCIDNKERYKEMYKHMDELVKKAVNDIQAIEDARAFGMLKLAYKPPLYRSRTYDGKIKG